MNLIETDSYIQKGKRKKLVDLLKQKGIKDQKVLAAIGKIPRHVFFENIFWDHAYEDKAFPIGEGQTISQPYTVAFQTELLKINPGDSVLEIGTGSGYQASIIAELGAKLYTIERLESLFNKSKVFLKKMGYKVNHFLGDGSVGLQAYAPFDRIIVTAGSPNIPKELLDQLNPNGIIVIPSGDETIQEMLRVIKKNDGSIEISKHGKFKFVPLKGKSGWGVK